MKKSIRSILCIVLVLCTLNFIPATLANATEVTALVWKGDVNGDGEILTEDARLALSYSIGLIELSLLEIDRADMNSDGLIDTSDVINILKSCADLSVDFFEPLTHKTPYTKHSSSQKVQYCETIVDYAETFATGVSGDRSNPLYTPLVKGTYDRVTKVDDEFVYLASGRKTYKDAVKVFSGYQMPNSTVTHKDIVDYKDESTDIYFALDWKVPFNVTIAPQSYETGYNSREFNLVNDTFTATYVDIKFYNISSTDALEHTYPQSDVIKSSKWTLDSINKTATLRIYLREKGAFYGYKAYYNEKNYLVISIKEMPQTLKGMVIELDPGHGGNDPGACSGSYKECEIAYDMAQELEKLLVAQGATVIYTYKENVKPVPEIVDRRLTAYELNPDMYISIHLNSSTSSGAKGSSVYYYKNYSCELSKSISVALAGAVKNGAGYTLENDGSHFYPFHVTRIENCPSVLVECGYISNSSERSMMTSASGKKAIAQGIYNGILNYINAQ